MYFIFLRHYDTALHSSNLYILYKYIYILYIDVFVYHYTYVYTI